jgi:hypothetical protein
MESVKALRGFFRVQITEDDEIKGDSGVVENQVTNLGFLNYLVNLIGAMAGSSQIGFVGLGTGTAPGAADTSLQGEVEVRASVTAATSSDSKTVRFTATFASENSFVTDTQNIANIGLFALSEAGVLFAGNTFASSSCAVNQAVQVTYDLVFS